MSSETRRELLTEADVLKVAKLARLDLEPAEVARMANELSAIVGYVHKLSELDTSNVAPTSQVHVERIDLRADEPSPSLDHDVALAEGPRVAHDGFAVPGFVDE
jgi:aspartyl-tRNA(Asn)/glutamyl-tRNA(Gln) amidotransferase subunit C